MPLDAVGQNPDVARACRTGALFHIAAQLHHSLSLDPPGAQILFDLDCSRADFDINPATVAKLCLKADDPDIVIVELKLWEQQKPANVGLNISFGPTTPTIDQAIKNLLRQYQIPCSPNSGIDYSQDHNA